MEPRFRRALLCVLVLLAALEDLSGANVEDDPTALQQLGGTPEEGNVAKDPVKKRCDEDETKKCENLQQKCEETEDGVKCVPKDPVKKRCDEDETKKCENLQQKCEETEDGVKCVPKDPVKKTCDAAEKQKCENLQQKCEETEDGVKCVQPSPTACTEEMKRKCRDMHKACDDSGKEANCTDTCPQDEATKCKKFPYKECKVHNGSFMCVCQSGLKETHDGQCKIGRKVTVRFKISNLRIKRETVDNRFKNCIVDKTKLVEMLKNQEPNIDENTIVCNGADVTFDVFVQDDKDVAMVTDTFVNCNQRGKPPCKLGDVNFEVGEVNPTKQCKDLKVIANDFGMECIDSDNGTIFSCDGVKTQAIGSAKLDGMPFEICKPRPCNETCQGDDRKHCVLESCVCKPQFKYDPELKECKNICEAIPNLCHREAVCVPGENYQNFYCRCPPKRTGPQCQRENKPLQSAQLNIVIVGVVLSSLLLMCFVVSASIISRLKKKLEGPNFKKDPERNPQRELRGYDGPYRASDPASLHRERDYTSL